MPEKNKALDMGDVKSITFECGCGYSLIQTDSWNRGSVKLCKDHYDLLKTSSVTELIKGFIAAS